MNYMKQVATMLGVKLEEPFEVILDNQTEEVFTYMLTERGCVRIKSCGEEVLAPNILCLLLTGHCAITRQHKWEPRLMDLAEFLTRRGLDPAKYVTEYYCSQCGEPGNRAYKYCPECGVKME